ncbi:MAG: FMN-binding negative transcriptional regulator [Acidiferrobacterales bacterium]
MYIPVHFEETRRERLINLIGNHSFGQLVSVYDGVPIASHLPFLIDVAGDADARLLGHMARANPQWRSFDSGTRTLVIFQGPQAYVSPSWYQSPGVPTWNYVAVHVYGVARTIDDVSSVRSVLERLTARHEAGRAPPWTLDMSGTNFDRLLAEIVGFEITITDIQGKFKLSQNRPESDQRQIIDQLRRGSGSEAALAGLMEAQRDGAGPSCTVRNR